MTQLIQLAEQASACTLCSEHLPLGPRPVFQVSSQARILIVGQAPGTKVHETGIPFDDPSGVRLREWMGVSREEFYDSEQVAILPMGFCYPGRGRSGDLPPRPECAVTWRQRFLECMPGVELTLLVGQYAMRWHLGSQMSKNLTETVRNWRAFTPTYLPLPHPSPRNNIWLKRNPWFEAEVIAFIRKHVQKLLR
jgi:uracil-DNA glycosylase